MLASLKAVMQTAIIPTNARYVMITLMLLACMTGWKKWAEMEIQIQDNSISWAYKLRFFVWNFLLLLLFLNFYLLFFLRPCKGTIAIPTKSQY